MSTRRRRYPNRVPAWVWCVVLLPGCSAAAERAGTLGVSSNTGPVSVEPTTFSPNTDPNSTTPVSSPATTAVAVTNPSEATAVTITDPIATDATVTQTEVTTTVLPNDGTRDPSDADCPVSERGAVVYRPLQRAVLCEQGVIVLDFPVTTARRVPKSGDYTVSSRNRWVRSTVGGHESILTDFVAFTKTSPRIAFHTVPKDLDGRWGQPLSSVGSLSKWGASAGCIRVLPETAGKIWNFLRNGDLVRILG